MAYKRYYVNSNPQSDGFHEVHVDDNSCIKPPSFENRRDLGMHSTCTSAIEAARRQGYAPADGCFYCNRPCHTR